MKYTMFFMLKALLIATLFTSIPVEIFAKNKPRQTANQPTRQTGKQTTQQKQKRKQAGNQDTITIPSIFGKKRTDDIVVPLNN